MALIELSLCANSVPGILCSVVALIRRLSCLAKASVLLAVAFQFSSAGSIMICSCWRSMLTGMVCLSATIAVMTAVAAEPSSSKEDVSQVTIGREIFLREWLPNDPRSHGGDGLGPVFNDTSCVSCHNQGGVGGGGAEGKNVVVITAIHVNGGHQRFTSLATSLSSDTIPAAPGGVPPKSVVVPPAAAAAEHMTDLTIEEKTRKVLLEELRALHPGLVAARSVVLHKSGTDANYSAWRDKTLGLTNQIFGNPAVPPMMMASNTPPRSTTSSKGGFFADLAVQAQQSRIQELQPPHELLVERTRALMSRIGGNVLVPQVMNGPGFGRHGMQVERNLAAIPTQRNSIALFGAGLIDGIPDDVIEAAAAEQGEEFPEVSGRVARLRDGKIGRFGWKAQKATLHDFTMTACAVELGLNVPDHPQAGVPLRPDYQPAGFDLNRDECLALVRFLKELPAPTRTELSNDAVVKEHQLGEQSFAKIGCAACHKADMGEVHGIFSDLLVHDMGSEMRDSGSYGVFQPQSQGNDADDPLAGLLNTDQQVARIIVENGSVATLEEPIPDKMIGAGRQEWRTAPLWGVRDSAPYMHDGRAATLEQAIAFHSGEAQLSANRFFRLPHDEKSRVLAFLRSLVAPDQTATAAR